MPAYEPPLPGPAPLRHRPLVPVLAGMVLGILLDAALRPALSVWLATGAAGVLLAGLAAWRRWPAAATWFLAAVLVVPLAGANHLLRARALPPDHVSVLLRTSPGLYWVRADVREIPRRHTDEPAFGEAAGPPREYWSVIVGLDALSGDRESWRPATGGVTVFVQGGRPQVRLGDGLEFLAELRANQPPTNPGQRDLRAAYEREGSYATASVSGPEALRVVAPSEPSLWPPTLVRLFSARLQGRLDLLVARAPDPAAAGLVQALIFGDRSGLDPDQEARLKESDTLHFLAISGLHVGIFYAFVCSAFAFLGLPVRARSAASIALIWAYVLFTGGHVSAVRAGLMLSFVEGARLTERQHDTLSAVAASALLILAFRPGQLFSPGFQLTFAAVWAMVCVYPQFAVVLWPWQDFLARAQRVEERTIRGDLVLLFRSYVVLSVTVWLATAPIRLHHFNSLCLIAPLLNLFVWLLVLPLLLVSLGLAACLAAGWGCAGALFACASFLGRSIDTLILWSSHVPGFGVYVPSPPVWWLALFYVFLAIWVLRDRLPAGRRAFLCAAVVLAAAYAVDDAAARLGRDFTLILTDVGSGQAALIDVPGSRPVLIDAGSSRRSAERAVAEVLWHRRFMRLGAIVLSHYDRDHCDFVPYLARRFRIDSVAVPPVGPDAGYALAVRQWLRSHGLPPRPLAAGTRLASDGLAGVILHPGPRFLADRAASENDRSAVLRCAYEGFSFLFTGDIEEKAIRDLVARHRGQLTADVVVMPHHGHYDPALPELLQAAEPRIALLSGRPGDCDPRTRALLDELGVPLWITGVEGAIIITLDGGKLCVTGRLSGRSRRIGRRVPGP
jgi:competence protein ComEC